MRKIYFIAVLLFLGTISYAQVNDEILVDDFESQISAGETVDAGSGGGSTIEVKASAGVKQRGNQSLQINFESVSNGYMWVGRGYGLDVTGAAAWLVEPKNIDFGKFNGVALWLYGANTGASIAVDLIDSGKEYWRYLINDNFSGWKEFTIGFGEFFARGDWQPESADKNAELNMPINAVQFEVRPEAKGTIYVDNIRFVSLKK